MICCNEYENFGCFLMCAETVTNPAIIADEDGIYTLSYQRNGTTYTTEVTAVEDEAFILPNVFGVGVNYFTLTNPNGRDTFCYKISIQRTEPDCPILIADDKRPDSCSNACNVLIENIDIVTDGEVSNFHFEVSVNMATQYRLSVYKVPSGDVALQTEWQSSGDIIVAALSIFIEDTEIFIEAGDTEGNVCSSVQLYFSFATLPQETVTLNLADELDMFPCVGGINDRELLILANYTGSAITITGNNMTLSPAPTNPGAVILAQKCSGFYVALYILVFNK